MLFDQPKISQRLITYIFKIFYRHLGKEQIIVVPSCRCTGPPVATFQQCLERGSERWNEIGTVRLATMRRRMCYIYICVYGLRHFIVCFKNRLLGGYARHQGQVEDKETLAHK